LVSVTEPVFYPLIHVPTDTVGRLYIMKATVYESEPDPQL
jgi:hypothetical protein